ncbi:hypothetical protein TRAPUB_6314 [Trametes pubescens]|uniref:F-box domain-containing protein n=1 Tax=Trametes pubescens TaxID=154538 RepID=A0A1M2W6T8_TRAPU|nr:hypothetical protein TRAPUB_6314 [Trametes pubescens]
MPEDRLDKTLSAVLTAALENCQEVLQSNVAHTSNFQVNTRSTLNTRRSSDRLLPAEILIISFQYVLDAVSMSAVAEGCIWESAFRTSPVLRTLSRVSRVWRHLILNLPSVWTVISDYHPDAFMAYVERSRDRPISVHLGLSGLEQGFPELGLRLRELRGRLSELYWTTNRPLVSKVEDLKFRAPLLEVLYISHDYTDPDDMDDDDNTGCDTPILFKGYVPNLRRFHLAAVGWLPGNHFESLTHLCLNYIFHPVKFSDIIGLLSRCPQLVHLVFIAIVVSSEHDNQIPPLQPPELWHPPLLPNLRRLSFDHTPAGVVNDYLRFLAPRHPHFALQVRHIPREDSIDLTAVGISQLSPVFSAPLTHLAYIRPHWHSHISIAASGPHSALRFDTDPVHIDDKAWSWEKPYVWAFEQLHKLSIAAHVKVFYFGFYDGREPGRLITEYIMNLPALEQLVVYTDDLSRALRGLYNHNALAWGPQRTEWGVRQLDIVVVPDITAARQRNFFEPFDGVDPDAYWELNIEKVCIHSPFDEALFEGPLDALRELVPLQEYYQGSAGPRIPFPEVCYEPAANADWTGAGWDFPN